MLFTKLDVDDGADDLHDFADVSVSAGSVGRSHISFSQLLRLKAEALQNETGRVLKTEKITYRFDRYKAPLKVRKPYSLRFFAALRLGVNAPGAEQSRKGAQTQR